jgi:hypothetical protein
MKSLGESKGGEKSEKKVVLVIYSYRQEAGKASKAF